MDGQNRMLKEQLVSHLRFEAERSEVLLMAKGRCIMCGPAGIRRKDKSEPPSPVEKYSILHTAVYRARTETKHEAEINEEGGVCSGKVLSKKHKDERENSVCQPLEGSDHEKMEPKRSLVKVASTTSEDNSDKRTEIQKSVLQPSCLKKVCKQPDVECSLKKPIRAKVYSYDETEPTDDDIITCILRLRGKLGWQTKLPSCECLARETDVARLQKFALTRPLLPRDSGEYIYCLQKCKNNLRVPYNPYNLQAISTNTAMHSKEYWTITASFVSKFHVNEKLGEMEATPVPQWLRERCLYYRLLNLNLFSNFRMKKFLLHWKINAGRSKANRSKSV
ncbi:dynein axonemal heavy chain 14 isoform X2 [Tympanuchus pallidicinctus]|uniref:dynein axonemal heavy chain 14 isoform X2 n=1 Tax=Tympanuchus pallidicinctus TaxID=109042 RepID=UPI002286E044|nr:dynein axonemal heavy chain 14 isoform X2 [Tympanuchus pallidicinctus]